MSDSDLRLPSLSALRAFDAAARRLSFAQAAEELHVTPAALSFQVRRLEEELGLKLFHRGHRAVTLTEAGAALAAQTGEGFAAFRRGLRALDRFRGGARLVVTAGPTFTTKWLAPRLYDFARAHPDIELVMSASLRLMDFERDEVDVAIRFGPTPAPRLFSETLLEERVTPMCAPSLAERLRAPEDLLAMTLIHVDIDAAMHRALGWEGWFTAAGVEGAPPRGGQHFSNADHAIEAAAQGGGVLLGRACLTRAEIAQGRLVAPFDLAVRSGLGFRFLCRHGEQDRPSIAAFRDWLKAEIVATPDPLAQMRTVELRS